jgi:TPR repeat protein
VAPFRIPANTNEPLPEPRPVIKKDEPVETPKPAFPAEQAFPPVPAALPAPDPKAPRYGRAIAPLPPHLIASVTPPPRESLPPAQVRLRPAAPTLGKSAVLRGTPFASRRGGRPWRRVMLGLMCVGGAVIVSRSDFVAGLAQRIGTRPPRESGVEAAPVAIPAPPPLTLPTPPPQAVAATQPAVPTAAAEPPASAPASDRLTDLTIRAKSGDTGAQYDLGVIFARGDGVPQDYAKAASWFREAAINGNVAAQYNLAVLYEHGLGMPQNMNEALIWYHSAAARNYPSAQYNLAISYAQGHGTPQDMVSAARWYLRAAQHGVVAAMVNFAILCEGGQGTDKSPTVAYAWYRAAGARGDDVAAKRADELYRQLSADDKKAADAAAGTAVDSIHETLLPPTTPGKSAAARPAQTPG